MSEMESSEERKVEPGLVESAMKTRLKSEALLCDPQLIRKLSMGENETDKGVKKRTIIKNIMRFCVFIELSVGFGILVP